MWRRSFLWTHVVRQDPSVQTFLQTRSALAGTASNVVAVKTAAAVPISVIERTLHFLCGANNLWCKQQFRPHSVPENPTRNLFRCAETCSENWTSALCHSDILKHGVRIRT